MRRFVSLLTVFLALSGVAYSQESSSNSSQSSDIAKEVKTLADIEEISLDNSVTASLKKQIMDFARRKGIKFGQVENGRIFVFSVQEVDRSTSDPRFAQARVVAFERAWLDAQKQIAYFIVKRVTTKTVRKIFENNSEGAENIELSNWDVLKAKVAALSDAAINKALEKLGVDPSKFGNLTYEKKKELLNDTLIKEILRETSAELAGTFIVQTFEGEVNGVHGVGVIAMYSPKLKYIARAIATGSFPKISSKVGHPIDYYLPKTPQGFMSTWGVRVVFTEDNLPAIISFGQWAHSYTGGDPTIKERNRKYAIEKAELLADSYISEFLNSALYAKERSRVGQQIKEEAVFKNGDTVVESVNRLVDERWAEIKRISKSRLSGTHTVATKLLKLPSGQELAVVVEVWTYKGFKGAQALKRNYHVKSKNAGASHSHEKKRSYVTEGKDMVEINDF